MSVLTMMTASLRTKLLLTPTIEDVISNSSTSVELAIQFSGLFMTVTSISRRKTINTSFLLLWLMGDPSVHSFLEVCFIPAVILFALCLLFSKLVAYTSLYRLPFYLNHSTGKIGPERKNSDIYGPWKIKRLADNGIVTRCIAPTRINDQYMTNVLLKINSKRGGINSLLSVEHARSIPLVSTTPTILIGMDVSHGSPGRADVPSIAAVVSSREWPLISRYRASVRTQSGRVETIDNLFKPVSPTRDEGMIRELLDHFYTSSKGRKPENIIIFRDGVSESQFNQVLNIELEQIMEACKFLQENWKSKFLVIVAQKNHHTKFFQPNSPDNVPPGTIIDDRICHPNHMDFYLCAQSGPIGTTRPTHYHVLLDQIGFSADDLQELVHSLSYVYQRSTTAISVVAPICYAHLAAAQMGQFIKLDDMSDTASGQSGGSVAGGIPQLPRLDDKVKHSMFFC